MFIETHENLRQFNVENPNVALAKHKTFSAVWMEVTYPIYRVSQKNVLTLRIRENLYL